jgi:hypothetical protein
MTAKPLLAAVLVLAGLATGCTQDRFERYCEVVAEQQTPLTEALAPGGPTALLAALPIFEELREAAPDDIRDDWTVVITTLTGLRTALEDAGVDPTTYDRDAPPAGLSTEQRDRIDAAAARLTTPTSAGAFNAVEQQARDVCKTPLSL